MDKEKKDFIKINIVGKCLKKKSFKIKLNANVDIVKRLILARLKKNGNSITPKIKHCFLIANNNVKLKNKKKIKYYYNKCIIYDNCELFLEIKLKNNKGCVKNEFEFGKLNAKKKNNIANRFNLFNLTTLVRSVSNNTVVENDEVLKESWYDDLSWDDTPINDEEWE